MTLSKLNRVDFDLGAVVFDFDGLIIDTETPDFRSWQELFAAEGVDLDLATWAPLIGSGSSGWNPYTYLEQQVGRPIDQATIRATRRARYADLVANEAVRPGVTDWIDTARDLGLPVGVASSSTRQWVETHLTTLGLRERSDTIRTSDDVPATKPDPAVYLRALDDLGVEPHHALALEDSANGIAAAKAAGMTCIAVPNLMTAALDLSAADHQLGSLAELSLYELLGRCRQRH